MTFTLELDCVDSGWVQAANAPDGVSFSLHDDDRVVSTYEWLHVFCQLYDVLRSQDSATDTRFAVVELDETIHIVYRNSTATTACATTYEDGLTEVTAFLRAVFQQLDATSDDGEREEAAPQLNSQLRELTLAEIYADVTTR